MTYNGVEMQCIEWLYIEWLYMYRMVEWPAYSKNDLDQAH